MGLFKSTLIFLAGLDVGIWLAQNHKVPQVENPAELVAKVKQWLADKGVDKWAPVGLIPVRLDESHYSM